MHRKWVVAFMVASGLLAQAPPPEPPPAPAAQAPAAKVEAPKTPEAAQQVEAPKAPEAVQRVETPAPAAQPAAAAEPKPFDQWRPSQRKYAYTLARAVLAAHELGYYQGHPRTVEVRDALEALLATQGDLADKAKDGLTPVAAYLGKLYANHGLYDAEGRKTLMEGDWKSLRGVIRAAVKASVRTGHAAETKGLEARFTRLRGLLFDPKVDATAPSWAAPEPPAKGKKARKPKDPKVPGGFHEQRAVLDFWVKQAMHYVDNTLQEVEIKGEKKKRLLPDPAQIKALGGLVTWLDRDDLEVLRDPGMGWLDLRRLATLPGTDGGRLGMGLLAKAEAIAASQAPEGAAAALPLLPMLQPVMGESKFSKGDEKRQILAEVKLLPAAANLDEQMAAFEKLGQTRAFEVK